MYRALGLRTGSQVGECCTKVYELKRKARIESTRG